MECDESTSKRDNKVTENKVTDNKVTDFNIHRKIFVGNISYRVKSRKLTKFFSKFGPVEYCYIVKDHIKKWSRGIAFVTFKDEESMHKALQASEDDLYFDQRQMRVKPAELSTKATYWQARPPTDDDDDDSDDEEVMEEHIKLDHTLEDAVHPECLCLVDSLFDDVLLRIFTLLSWKERVAIERVCWRWKHLVQRTWVSQKHLHFQNIFRQFQGLNDKMLNSLLLRCGQYLQSLDLSASPRFLTDFSMDIIGKYCPEIQELDVSAVKITDVSMRNLVSRCTNLHKVKLRRCLHVTDNGLSTILMSGQPLVLLDIADNSHLTGQCFKSINSDLDTLQTLVLTDCYKVTDNGFMCLLKHSRNLEELYMNNCRSISEVSLRQICQTCTRLRLLHAVGINFDSVSLEDLKKLENLEDLNLSLCRMVTDSILISVAQACSKLRCVDISGCHTVTDIGVLSLAAHPHLRSINISYLNQVTEDSVIKLGQVGNLVKFVARATRFTTDKAIKALVSMCPRLRHVDLSACFQITNNIFDGFKNTLDIHSENTVELILGGTSVDWGGDGIDWGSGIAHVNVSMYNLAIKDLQADRDMMLPSYDEEDWEDEIEEYRPHPPLSAYQQDHVEMCQDWDDEDYDDDFLDNDDPLEYERWNMS